MPWCETCAKFWTPSSMRADGSCPSCGRVLAAPPADAGDAPDAALDPAAAVRPGEGRSLSMRDIRELAAHGDEAEARAPWHFKLMVAALVVYLGYRAVQLIALLFR